MIAQYKSQTIDYFVLLEKQYSSTSNFTMKAEFIFFMIAAFIAMAMAEPTRHGGSVFDDAASVLNEIF
ncbi:hypothetical protein NPIL_139791 [Nephila pilipes]|uniref:Uncharacterized protein n=1 Tax=Nephila pilipes TaxID=299642 RepID=A0A8X6TSA8_NEPPI|nr:hypothetical protein NPIL_139791 [Nephila pilipes]